VLRLLTPPFETRFAALDDAARARSPWYRDGAFRNFDEPDGDPGRRSIVRFLRWRLSRRAPPLVPDAPDRPIEVRPLASAELAPPARGLRVAWLGHSSLFIGTAGLRILVDPVFGGLPLVRRLAPPPIGARDMPPIDVVLISHNHYDHLDLRTLEAVRLARPDARVFVPLGLEGLLRGLGFLHVRALDWWEEALLARDARVVAVPARHWSKRGAFDDGQSHWAGFLIEAEGRRLYYAGDTAWGGHFEAIAARLGSPDAAIVPIGAYAPRWFMGSVHVTPDEALEAARVVGARIALPCHFGTFRLGDEALGEPPLLFQRAAEAAPRRVAVRFWRPGDVQDFP
jgi:L-ascorbate metabolism protein UlaG (beta-lactamase superfamily)